MVAAFRSRPVVAICADRTLVYGHETHSVLDFYIQAVLGVVQGMPLIIPAIGAGLDIDWLLDNVDGVVLTGSPSNVAPERYSAPPLNPPRALDLQRDATVLPLVPRLVETGVPILGVCRGFQEMNVAYGGSLHAAVHDQPDMLDHREGDHGRPIAQWYESSHAVNIASGGCLERISRTRSAMVNSLHHQGIDRLGAGLQIEATATDGLIEALSVAGAPRLALGVQWHPEARVGTDALSRSLFEAFGEACHDRRANR